MGARDNSTGFRLLFVLSIILAILAFGTAVIVGHRVDAYYGARVSYWFSAIWFVSFIIACILYRRRGLWLLIGAPLALFVPIYFEIFYTGGCNGASCM